MPFRDSVKENLWFALLGYEYERHVRDLLQRGLSDGWLGWSEMTSDADDRKRQYLTEQATPFICLSVRQSKELFTAAEQASDATKPLLSYYGMMNLVKGLLAVDAPDYFLNRDNLWHGISVREGDKHTFKFSDENVTLFPRGIYGLGRISVGLPPLCAADEKVVVRVEDIFKALPDLFWDYQKVAKLEPRDMNTFAFGFPERQFNSYSQEFYVDAYITRPVYEQVKDRLPLNIEELFNFEAMANESIHLKSKLNTSNTQELVDLLDTFSTVLMTSNARFIPLKFACAIEDGKRNSRTEQMTFCELEMLYILTFYMSTLARYRPHIWDAAISGRETEFVTVFKKFLYYADSKFIGLIATRVSKL
jgi:YaaC-like Protein